MPIAVAASACGQSARSDSGDGRGNETGGQAGEPSGGTSSSGAGSGGAGAANAGASVGGTSSGTGGSDAGSGGSSGSAGGGAPPTGVDASGPWAMFAFEDPVAVSLRQDEDILSGIGCFAGLNNAEGCTPISKGSIVGQNVTFEFPVPLGGPYAADVFISADGTRMAGAFHAVEGWGFPLSWVRIPDGETWLPQTNSELSVLVAELNASYSLTLNGAGPIAGFSPDETYSFGVSDYAGRPLVRGDLGSFWEGELAWNEAERTLIAGPVPETHPELPIELLLHFEDTTLREVEATFASGETATFAATAQ